MLTARCIKDGLSRVIAAVDRLAVRTQMLFGRVSPKPSACSLLLHSVGGLSDAPYLVRTGLPSLAAKDFERLCAWFAARRFQTLTVREFMQHHRAGAIPPRTLILTFDDGFRDNYTIAADVLHRFDMKATFYIVSDWVGRETPAWLHRAAYYCDRWPGGFAEHVGHVAGARWQRFTTLFGSTEPSKDALLVFRQALRPHEQDEVLVGLAARYGEVPATGRLYLNWPEIGELARAGMEIGAHGVSHRSLWALSDDEARREIRQSGERLQEHLGPQIGSYSYPFGHFLPQHVNMLAEAGYTNAVTVRRLRNDAQTPPFELGRFGVNSNVAWHSVGCMCLGRSEDSVAVFKRRLGRARSDRLASAEAGIITVTDCGQQYCTDGVRLAFG